MEFKDLIRNFIDNEMANGSTDLGNEYSKFLHELETTSLYDSWDTTDLYDHFWGIGFEYSIGRVYRNGNLIEIK